MEPTLIEHLRPAVWRRVSLGVLALGCLGFIAWAGVAVWRQPCGVDSGLGSAGSGACPSPLRNLSPLLVALGFWAVGLMGLVVGRLALPVAFFLVVAGILATGTLANRGSDLSARWFYLLLAWLAPLTVHFHIVLPGRLPGRIERVAVGAFSLLAVLWSLPVLLWPFAAAQQQAWFDLWRTGVRLGFAVAFLLGMLWLFRAYRHRASVAAQRRIRLVAFGTLVAFAPLFLFSLLPETLGAPLYVPYEYSFPWLLLSPLSYAYARVRHRLVPTETVLSRALIYYLLALLLWSLYLATAGLLDRLAVDVAGRWLLIVAFFSIGAVLLLVPLQQGLERLVKWVFYGREIRDTRIVEGLLASAARTLDRETLRRLLVEDLGAAMGFTRVALFLKDGEGQAFTLLEAAGFARGDFGSGQLPIDSDLALLLEAAAAPLAGEQVRQRLVGTPLQGQARPLLSAADAGLWLPLVSDGVLQGLLLIDTRPGDSFFTAEDKRILSMLAYQAGIAAHNIWLLEKVRAQQAELARSHRQLLIGRERERLRLARELHDSAVQQLLGVSRLLETMGRRDKDGHRSDVLAVEGLTLEDLQQELLTVVRQLRDLSSELRPAWLRELGLTAALAGEVERQCGTNGMARPRVELDLDPSGTGLPEPVTICLFRVAQEALRNALCHAQAQRIELHLRLLPTEVILDVRDDGCGFRVPAHLSELTQAGHFGLAGMAEQVEWGGGTFTVHSQPGAGTTVTVRVPLEEDDDGIDTGSAGR